MKNLSDLILLQFSVLVRTLNESPAVSSIACVVVSGSLESQISLSDYLLDPIDGETKLSGEEHYLK